MSHLFCFRAFCGFGTEYLRQNGCMLVDQHQYAAVFCHSGVKNARLMLTTKGLWGQDLKWKSLRIG